MIKIVTSFQTLMYLAHLCGQAELKAQASGLPEDIEAFRIAEENHEAYRQLCLQSDRMTLGMSQGDLWR